MISASQTNTQKHYLENNYHDVLHTPQHIQTGHLTRKNMYPQRVLSHARGNTGKQQRAEEGEMVRMRETLEGVSDMVQDMRGDSAESMAFFQTEVFSVRPNMQHYQQSIQTGLVQLVHQLDRQEERDPFNYNPCLDSHL